MKRVTRSALKLGTTAESGACPAPLPPKAQPTKRSPAKKLKEEPCPIPTYPDASLKAVKSEPSDEVPKESSTEAAGPSAVKTEVGDVEEAAGPVGWEAQLEGIERMRWRRDAPVDVVGCHALADPAAPAPVRRFQTLVALMLSSQTKDEVTAVAMGRLKAGGCEPRLLVLLPEDQLAALIHPVGFWRKKAVYLQKTAQILLDRFGGDVPNSLRDLCALPGVGPKMAHLTLQAAWEETVGIGVDTHVHRIANRLGWVRRSGSGGEGGAGRAETRSPEETRRRLEAWLPRRFWRPLNPLLVGFGQQICLPQRPRCQHCLIAQSCPYATANALKKSP